MCERRRRESYTSVRRVEDGIKALKERLAVDEVETFARWRPEAAHDEQDVVCGAAYG
jgi:hypothetical protein